MSKTKVAGPPATAATRAQRLGVKRFDGAEVTAGPSSCASGDEGLPGVNVGRGGDDTLFAMANGVVKFGERRGRKHVSVLTD